MQISERLSLYSSLLSGTLPCIFKLPWPLWTLSPQCRLLWSSWVSHFCITFQKVPLGRKLLIVGFTLFDSFLSGITVLCCLLYNVCSSCFTHFVQFSSCSQRKYKSVISYSIAARRGSHSASISVKRIPYREILYFWFHIFLLWKKGAYLISVFTETFSLILFYTTLL